MKCICGHDYSAHFNGNDDTDLSCFHCDCKDFKSEEENAVVAQLAEHLIRNEGVSGSIPLNGL
jgi:hypothetical protein